MKSFYTYITEGRPFIAPNGDKYVAARGGNYTKNGEPITKEEYDKAVHPPKEPKKRGRPSKVFEPVTPPIAEVPLKKRGRKKKIDEPVVKKTKEIPLFVTAEEANRFLNEMNPNCQITLKGIKSRKLINEMAGVVAKCYERFPKIMEQLPVIATSTDFRKSIDTTRLIDKKQMDFYVTGMVNKNMKIFDQINETLMSHHTNKMRAYKFCLRNPKDIGSILTEAGISMSHQLDNYGYYTDGEKIPEEELKTEFKKILEAFFKRRYVEKNLNSHTVSGSTIAEFCGDCDAQGKYNLTTAKIILGTKKVNEQDAIGFNKYAIDVATGFHPKGTTTKSILTHEIGHLVDAVLDLSHSSFAKKLTYDEIYKNISRYGANILAKHNDISEAIAEAFAEYMDSDEPRPLAKELGELIESEYKKKYGGEK